MSRSPAWIKTGWESFYQTVDELKRTNHMAILLVSHDLDVVRRYADRVALMQGTIVRQGDPENVFDSEEFAQVFYSRVRARMSGVYAPDGHASAL